VAGTRHRRRCARGRARYAQACTCARSAHSRHRMKTRGYLALTVLYLALTVLYMALTVLYATVLFDCLTQVRAVECDTRAGRRGRRRGARALPRRTRGTARRRVTVLYIALTILSGCVCLIYRRDCLTGTRHRRRYARGQPWWAQACTCAPSGHLRHRTKTRGCAPSRAARMVSPPLPPPSPSPSLSLTVSPPPPPPPLSPSRLLTVSLPLLPPSLCPYRLLTVSPPLPPRSGHSPPRTRTRGCALSRAEMVRPYPQTPNFFFFITKKVYEP